MLTCKRCGSDDLREYHHDVVSVGTDVIGGWYVACTVCGLHADYDDWLDAIECEGYDDGDYTLPNP